MTGKVTSAEEYAEARAAMVRLNLPFPLMRLLLHDAEVPSKLPRSLLAQTILLVQALRTLRVVTAADGVCYFGQDFSASVNIKHC